MSASNSPVTRMDVDDHIRILQEINEKWRTRLSAQAEALKAADGALSSAYYLLSPSCPREMNVIPVVDDIGKALSAIRALKEKDEKAKV